jgi:uncharacterized protein (TIGR03382 family)
MHKPSPCLGAVDPDGNDRANCQTCARFKPGATGWVITGKTFRYGYLGGIEVVECLDRLPLEHGVQHAASVAPVTQHVCGADASGVTLRKRAVRWLMVSTVLSVAVIAAIYSTSAHAAPAERCQWVEPGAAPYGPHGDPVAAVMRLDIPEPHKSILAESVKLDTPAEVTRITRSGIGDGKRWREVRNMNFAGGRICRGLLDVSMWPAERSQIVRVHASGPYAVGFFPGCGNVAQMTDASYRPGVVERLRAVINPGEALASGPTAKSATPEPGGLALPVLALLAAALVYRRTRS